MTTTNATDENVPERLIDPNIDRMHIIRHQIQRIDDAEMLKDAGRFVLRRLDQVEGAKSRTRRRTRASLPERAILKLYLQLSPFVLIGLPVIPFCLLIYNIFSQIPEVMDIVQSEVLLAALIGAIAAFMIYFTGRLLRTILMRPANFL